MWPSLKALDLGITFAGKYKILGELGRGGMGEVYLAEDTTLSRKIALKLLPEETYQDSEARQRFLREAKAAAALDHPYICSVHEVGEAEGRLFIGMEYVEGKTLRDRLSAGPLPFQEALTVAAEVAEALQKAHENGIIHRDIKPANIMLMEKGHTKVMDFGLAKQVAGSRPPGSPDDLVTTLTEAGSAPGTPAYMSPEQLQGKTLDQRSDIFSFGVIFYEMLTGVHPFKRETGLMMVSAILSENPQPVAEFTTGVPERLQVSVGKMLAKDPDRRYQSMSDVLSELRAIMLSSGAEKKTSKFLRPARVAVVAIALAAIVLATFWLAKILFFKSPAEVLAFKERDWILITDFENMTGEQIFDGSLETAVTVGIQQSQYVNVFPRNRVRETLQRMRREELKKLDETVGREVALREGIKALLACQISKIGEGYLLTSRIVDPNTLAAVFSYSAQARDKSAVLDALDDLSRKVRRKLGESLGRISQQRLSLLRATTSSLEALKNFTDSRLGPQDMAAKLLHQAIDLDPDFALAHAELGLKYSIVGNRVKAEEHFQKALSLLDRLTIREQLWIRAVVEDWRGNRDQGIENYKAYLSQYPDDSAAWFRLGYAYMITGRPDSGVEPFKKVIEMDGFSPAAHINLATCYGMLKKNDLALASYEKAFELRPEEVTGIFVNGEYGFLLIRLGRTEEAARTFEKMLQQDDPNKKAMGRRSLALLNIFFGKYSVAQGHLEEAVRLTKTSNARLSELRNHIYLASVLMMKGKEDGFEKEMDAVRKIQKAMKIEPFFVYTIGRTFARSGRLKEAAEQFRDMESRLGDVLAESAVSRSNRSDQASFYRLKGEMELIQKRYGEAINSFQTAASLEAPHIEENLGYAYLRSGDLDKAIEKYQEFLQNYRLVGNESLEQWILAHYQLGKLYQQKGQREEARKYFERFLEIWKEGDSDLPALIDVKNRLARLNGPA